MPTYSFSRSQDLKSMHFFIWHQVLENQEVKVKLDIVRALVFGRHHFLGTSEHYGKAHGSLLSGWMNCSCMLLVSYIQQYFNHSSDKSGLTVTDCNVQKCRILVSLRYCSLCLCNTNHHKYPCSALHLQMIKSVNMDSTYFMTHY